MRLLARLELPDAEQLYQRFGVKDLPTGWNVLPGSTAATAIGDDSLRAGTFFGLIVPSAVMTEAFNIVLNPAHPAFSTVTIRIVRPFGFGSSLR